jgi:hypothetical protein
MILISGINVTRQDNAAATAAVHTRDADSQEEVTSHQCISGVSFLQGKNKVSHSVTQYKVQNN